MNGLMIILFFILFLLVAYIIVAMNKKESKIQVIEDKIKDIDTAATKGQMYLLRKEINRLKKIYSVEQIEDQLKGTSVSVHKLTGLTKSKADYFIKKLKAIK